MKQIEQMQHSDVIRFPILENQQGTLTPMEKSLFGHFILLSRPKRILELGVFRGLTSSFLCEFIAANQLNSKVVGFDIPDVITELRESALNQFVADSRLELVGGYLPGSLAHWLAQNDGPVEMALVDAMHDFRSVTNELSLLWPRLAEGGFILCHDFAGKYEGVRYAVERFAKKKGAMILPLSSTPEAQKHNHGSVLVALAKPAYQYPLSLKTRHQWMRVKQDLLDSALGQKLWFDILKPVLRGQRRDA